MNTEMKKKYEPIGHPWMKKYLRYFSLSLKQFPNEYVSKIFLKGPLNDEYLPYLCPICLKNSLVVDWSGYYETAPFSMDHFPPASVGGTSTVLICQKCNNEAGLQYENSLVERLDEISFQKKIPNSRISTRSSITNVPGWRHGELSVNDNQEFFFSLKTKGKSKLKDLSDWEKETNNNGKGWEMKVTFQGPSKDKVTLALLKAAYLYCFFNWGYAFVFSEQGDMMRKVLVRENKYPIPIGSIWFDFETPVHEGTEIPAGMCFIQKPKNLQCLVVNLPLRLALNKYSCVVPVLIPSPVKNFSDELQRINAVLQAIPQQVAVFIPLNNPLLHSLTDGYTRVWNELREEFGN